MKSAIAAASAVIVASLAVAAPASAQGLSFPLPGQSAPSAAPAPVEPHRPAVSLFQTESLSEQWNPATNPPQARDTTGACKDAATRMAEQSPSPPTPVACY